MPNYYSYPGSPLHLLCRLGKRRQTHVSSETCPAMPSFFALQVYSEATRPIVPEDNTDLSGFYSRPAGALSATGVAGAR
ncbi:UNVERIFIED_CONTAM: hypothetical protein FKN15_019043 [Acipenser sinensis]